MLANDIACIARDLRRPDWHPATLIAEVGAAFRAVELTDALGERLGQPAQLRAEDPLLAECHLAEPAPAQAEDPHRRIRPVDQEDPHLGPIEQAGAEVRLADRIAVEHALDIEIVDAHAGIVRDRRA